MSHTGKLGVISEKENLSRRHSLGEKMSEICHISYIFFFLFFSNTSVIFLFLADTGLLFPFVGFLLSPVKPDFFELGPDVSSS